MQSYEIDYTVTVSDFRKASYYALFLRNRKPLLIMFVVLIGVILYALAALAGLGTPNTFVFLLAAVYLAWGLWLFGGCEKNLKKYLSSPQCLLGCPFHAIWDPKQIHILVPDRNVDVTFRLKKLACAFELSAEFLLYISTQEVYILPKRALSPQQRVDLRTALSSSLGDRFSTRFTPDSDKEPYQSA